MKKLLLVLCSLLGTVGAMGQVTATLVTGYGDPLTLTQFKALAGTTGRFALVASSNTASGNSPRCDHWMLFTSIHNTTTLSEEALFYLEEGSTSDLYKVKRSSDGLYVSTSTSSTEFNATGSEFKLVNRNPNDATAAVWDEQSISFEDPTNSGNHYNANGVKYNGGAGAWTTYAVFGPIYKVTVKYVEEDGTTPVQEQLTDHFVVGGTTFEAPAIAGYAVQGVSSVTINADQTITFTYAASTFDYTVALTGDIPAGTTVTVKGKVVTDGASVSFDDAVAESDVAVTFPAEYSYMAFTATVSGTTITIDCYDNRWPVNFPKTQTFTRSDRHINSVVFEYGPNSETLDGLYVNTSTLCYQDLTTTKTVTLPPSTSVHPSFNVAGGWQHGFVYIDLNNDGDFTDDGELVSYVNEGNPTLTTAMPNFITTATEGTYRMRVKTDWASTDPGGNPGNPNNYIIDNGGMIVDVTLVVEAVSDDFASYVEANIKPWFENAGGYFQLKSSVVDANQSKYEAALVSCTLDTYNELNALIVPENMVYPETGYYRIKSSGKRLGETYIGYGTPEHSTVGLVTIAADDALNNPSTVIRMEATATTGVYKLSLQGLNVQNQTSNNQTFQATTDDGVEFTFVVRNPGVVAITNDFGTQGYLHESAWAAPAAVVRWTIDADPSQWTLEDATTVTVPLTTIGEASYATAYLPFGVTAVSGAAANVLELSANGKFVKTQGISEVPAGTGIVLIGAANAEPATLTIGDVTATVANNVLTGHYVAGTVSDAYVLAKGDEGLGFYALDGAQTVAANKAYIEKQADVKAILFGDDETGIESLTSATATDSAIYNMAGQRVSKAVRGLYIVGGKKVVVK